MARGDEMASQSQSAGRRDEAMELTVYNSLLLNWPNFDDRE